MKAEIRFSAIFANTFPKLQTMTEELHAEMYRRESEGDKESKNINQLENPKVANQEDNVVDEESS